MKNIMIPNYHQSWALFIDKYTEELEKIDKLIDGDDYNPLPENVLRFLFTPVDEIKVVILGQDTYPQKGVATGRSFEVGGLKDWTVWYRQVSLKHIVQNIYGCYTGESPYTNYTEIQKKIKSGEFKILPPNQIFDSWNEQGVLCLNAALTCRVGEPGSHSEYWAKFTEGLIDFISENNQDVKWFLWGSKAKEFQPLIKNGKIYASRHPMMCSEEYYNDFLKNPCFKETMDIINWLGI